MTTFSDLSKETGLSALNKYLETKSYITGFKPTQDDVLIFEEFSQSPPERYSHVSRWFRQINSYTKQEKKLWSKGSGNIKVKKEDEDLDLFGEETAEEKKIANTISAPTKVEEKKPKKKVIDRSQIVFDVMPTSTDVDLDDLGKKIRNIKIEGVDWSVASNKLPVAFGLFKLQIGCVIIDSLVGTDTIILAIECIDMTPEQAAAHVARFETGEEREDDDDEEDEEEDNRLVQSVQIVSFNKL